MDVAGVFASVLASLKKQPPVLWFFVAFCAAWVMAPDIQDFFTGFFAVVESAR